MEVAFDLLRSPHWLGKSGLVSLGTEQRMTNTRFRDSGHLPTLFASFLYFDLSFAVWVLLGPLGVQIARTLRLDASEKGLMVAVPVLAGAILRIASGGLVDRWGPKRVGITMQALVIAALLAAWAAGIHSYGQVLLLGVALGVAGASFAVALPLASRWYPPEHQGKALGIAGAGNSGTVITALVAPSLAAAIGWPNVFGVAAGIMVAVLTIFSALARESPLAAAGMRRTGGYRRLLRSPDAWTLMGFYLVTFGGFAGLASYLTIYFNTQFGLRPALAGDCTAAVVFGGSLVRPVGGAIADRIGGLQTLAAVYAVAAVAFALVGLSHGIDVALPALGIGMLLLGIGNGAVFQLVPQRFGADIGSATGLVGMAGGVGGFALAAGLGFSRQHTGGYGVGFLLFAGLAAVAFAVAASRGASLRTGVLARA